MSTDEPTSPPPESTTPAPSAPWTEEPTTMLPPTGEALPPEPPTEARPRIGYLVFGLILLGVVVKWALVVTHVATFGSLGWVFPAILVLAGAAGLLAALMRGRRGEVRAR